MEVKKGYKQTELGVIPEDWEITNMSNIVTVMTNGFVGTAKTHYTEGFDGIVYIQGYNILENSFNLSGIKYVTPQFHKSNSKSSLQVDDLLTIQTGDIGLTTIVPESLSGSNCHALIISRFNRNKVYPKFISYLFNSQNGRNRLRLIETGTTMKHLNLSDMLEFKIPLPALPEQTAIATALSDMDALITQTEKLIEKKKAMKQGMMQELLKPKDGWVTKKLGEIGTFSKGSGINKDQASSGDIRCIRYGELYTKHHNYIRTFYSYISKDVATTAKRIKTGDILFAGSGETKSEIGKCVAYLHDYLAYAGSDIVILTPNYVNSLFLGFLLNDAKIQKQKASRGQGDAVVHISAKQLGTISIHIPPIREQEDIGRTLRDMDESIYQSEIQLKKLNAIKQGMMQELLTGRMRLL